MLFLLPVDKVEHEVIVFSNAALRQCHQCSIGKQHIYVLTILSVRSVSPLLSVTQS